MYSEEQNRKEVADTFLEAFKEKDLSIALYGTGINTEEILQRVENMGGGVQHCRPARCSKRGTGYTWIPCLICARSIKMCEMHCYCC